MGLFRRDTPQEPSTLTAAAQRLSRATPRRAKAAAYNADRTITAAAERVKLGSGVVVNRPYQTWQAEAWNGYERVGEVWYGFNLVANVLSRVRVYAAAIGGADEAPIEAEQATKSGGGPEGDTPLLADDLALAATTAMNDLVNANFSSMIRAFSINMSVPGECLLCHLPVGPPDAQGQPTKEWSIRSTDEVQVRSTGAVLAPQRQSGAMQVNLPEDTYIARIWRQSPRFSSEPDSSMLAVAEPIEELLMLQRLVRSSTRSRLNAGLLFVPDGIVTARVTITPDPVVDEPLDPAGEALASVADLGGSFLADLMESMTTPVSDEGSASSVVPLVVTGPGDLGNQIKHQTFERSSDEWLVRRTERALERVLQGIDVPKEVVTGLADVKFANALVIDENLYKANIEPLALVFVDALTSVYLRPVLMAQGFSEEDVNRVVVWYDPSEIVTRPNSADDASEGYDRFLLSPATWRREHGFGESDKPTEAELAMMLLESKGQLPEDVTSTLLTIALPEILGKQRQENINNSVVPFPKTAENILNPPDTTQTRAVGEAR